MSGGTQGVGRATTSAVVISSVLVLVADFFLAKLLLYMFQTVGSAGRAVSDRGCESLRVSIYNRSMTRPLPPGADVRKCTTRPGEPLIAFKDVRIGFDEGDVLRGISFDVMPGEKRKFSWAKAAREKR